MIGFSDAQNLWKIGQMRKDMSWSDRQFRDNRLTHLGRSLRLVGSLCGSFHDRSNKNGGKSGGSWFGKIKEGKVRELSYFIGEGAARASRGATCRESVLVLFLAPDLVFLAQNAVSVGGRNLGHEE